VRSVVVVVVGDGCKHYSQSSSTVAPAIFLSWGGGRRRSKGKKEVEDKPDGVVAVPFGWLVAHIPL